MNSASKHGGKRQTLSKRVRSISVEGNCAKARSRAQRGVPGVSGARREEEGIRLRRRIWGTRQAKAPKVQGRGSRTLRPKLREARERRKRRTRWGRRNPRGARCGRPRNETVRPSTVAGEMVKEQTWVPPKTQKRSDLTPRFEVEEKEELNTAKTVMAMAAMSTGVRWPRPGPSAS